MRRRLAAAHSIDDLRDLARRSLPRMVFDYIDGAAQTESTARENRTALDKLALVPGPLADVSRRDASVSLFGRPSRLPIIIGPTGFAGAFWREGDLALARAAAAHGVPFVMSHGANTSLERLRQTAPEARQWFQLYLPLDRERWRPLVGAAAALGFEALEVTIDTAVPGRRGRDLRNGFGVPLRWTPGKLAQVAVRPRWAVQMILQGMPQPVIIKDGLAGGARHATVSDLMATQINPGVTWDDLKTLRDLWAGTLLVKGVLNPLDVEHAASAGYDGVVVSNHGGRQLDSAVGTIAMLPECVAAAGGRLSVLIDSGFRTGSDILKALILGAHAVQLGRSTLFGLAAGGEAGVSRALSILAVELDVAMALTGIDTLAKAPQLGLRPAG